MLKKMRWRIVFLAVASFFIVILFVGILVNAINYYLVTDRLDTRFAYIFKYEQSGLDTSQPGEFMELPNREENYMTRFFSVRYDENGEVAAISTDNIAEIDKARAAEYGEKIAGKDQSKGYIDNFRYMVSEEETGKVIAFQNAGREIDSIKQLLVLSLGVGFGSLLLVTILVILLSPKVVKPFVVNIENQKQFITNASHELKTPLTSISTSMDVIAMEHGEDEWVSNVKKQTQRMTNLVNELVVLSRLNEESPFPDKELFSLSDAAWEIVEVYQQGAKALEKTLEVNIQNNVSLVGEKSAVQKMLSVLLDNAIRYSDPKSVIRFDVYRKKNKIYLETLNNCHFDKTPDVARLFDRFYRPDGARSTETGGTGIGLAIAKAVAEHHGGEISAECPDEKSIRFRVIL